MTPYEFIAKWGNSNGHAGPGFALNEEQGAQSHFLDLCELLDVPKPGSADGYLFEEKSALIGGKTGYCDVSMRGVFAWENKAPGKNLDAALKQLLSYSQALSNPPLLVVCDRLLIRIHVQFTGHPSRTHEVKLEQLTQPDKVALLRRVWLDPASFRPKETVRDITELAANSFATLADGLRQRGPAPDTPAAAAYADQIAHFLTQCVFCFFAEDVGLLPGRMFERLVTNRHLTSDKLALGLGNLFVAMRDGGLYGSDELAWFNGGLFNTIAVPKLSVIEVTELRKAAALNWQAIDVSIFGTLFERGLDPAKRSQLGAHYTDPATIDRIIDPVLRQPLLQQWELLAHTLQGLQAKNTKKGDKYQREAKALFVGWLDTLKNFRVLDPACGSGNFLFLGLKALKDIEHRSHLEAAELGLDREADLVTGPHNVLGIELNEYAAELARMTVWIGELQWRLAHGYEFKTNPVLDPLDHIECRDALLRWCDTASTQPNAASDETRTAMGGPAGSDVVAATAQEASWPRADVVIGNPPFLGDRKMIRELGERYTTTLRQVYQGRVPGGADLVTYWFEKARTQIGSGQCQRAGLVATNSIRGGANQTVLTRIGDSSRIFNAHSDLPWFNAGAAVRVSLVCFGVADGTVLDDQVVTTIHPDLTSGDGLDLTQARPLPANAGASFIGTQKNGPFDIPGEIAREWLTLPNPNNQPNNRVLRPWANGISVTRRAEDKWIIDFDKLSEADACLFELPFAHVLQHVKPTRLDLRRDWHRTHWWSHGDPRPALKLALQDIPRQIITPRVSKYRVFAWFSSSVLPDSAVVAITRADDTTFGILHSRFHELWSLGMCTWMGVGNDPRYTPSTCFETFPFPPGMTPKDSASQRTETLPDGTTIPADISEQNVPLALMKQAQAATENASSQNPCKPLSEAGVARMSGPILKSEAYEALASEPPRSDHSKQRNKAQRQPSAQNPLTVRQAAIHIATAARQLNDLRENWLNPPQWVDWVSTPEEDAAGFPKRPVAKPGHADALKKRTLTNLYNTRPSWLTQAHAMLDQAVALAYGWADYSPTLPDDTILRRMLALNLSLQSTPAAENT